jgi:FKBP-type peptidyl-prolyl cis-trans isomerase SlyD
MSQAKVMALTYELRAGDAQGELIETSDRENPAEFLFGTGNLIEGFELHVKDLDPGDTFEFSIKAENAYGPKNPDAIVGLPKDAFMVDGQLAEDLLVVGKVVPMRDQEGNPLNGRIIDISEDTVTMDFNHPLSDMDLHFKGEVISKRDATEEEQAHGHVHTGKDGH